MSKIFGGGERRSAPAPAPQPTAPMPDPDSPALREAARRRAAAIGARSGRSSTILTTPESRGGDDYASTKLG